jgi:glucosamine 6-phosphate synthetase-like amidotransferase/phosphosugar isomerase protein
VHNACRLEIGVASTKAFTGSFVLTMMALKIAKEKGTISDKRYMNYYLNWKQFLKKLKHC